MRGSGHGGIRVNANQEIEVKMQKKCGGLIRLGRGWVQGGFEPGIEVIVQMQKKSGRGQGGCKPITGYYENAKKSYGGGGGSCNHV